MKKALALLTVAIMMFSMVACGSGNNGNGGNGGSGDGGDSSDPIYIGVIDAFTGDKASNGEYSKEGADMAMNEINEAGGVMGREVVLVYEDDQGTEAGGTNAFQKIVSENDLAAVCLNKYSSMVLAMEQFVAQEGIPAICCGSSVNIESSSTPNLFSTRKSDSGSGVTIANWCNELGMTKVAILHAPDALGTGMTPVIEAAFEELDIEAVSVQQFATEEKNFAPYVAKIIDSGCDGIIAIAQQQEAGLIMAAIDEAGIDVPCIGNSAYAQQVAIETSSGACDGWYSVTAFSPTATNEPTASWIADYQELYGRLPDMTSACMYDAVKLFCAAMEENQSTEWEDTIEWLKGLDGYEGVCSTYTYNGTPMLSSSEYIVQINGTTSEVVSRVDS